MSSCFDFIEQPIGGLLPTGSMMMFQLNDRHELYSESSVPDAVLNYAVTRLHQFLSGSSIDSVYDVAAKAAYDVGRMIQYTYDIDVVKSITRKELTRTDVRSIFRLAILEHYIYTGDISQIGLHLVTHRDVFNFNILIQRLYLLIEQYKPIIGMNISVGDDRFGQIDVMTSGVIWDIDCSNSEPDSDMSLKLLCYSLMLQDLNSKKYGKIHSIGVLNPYLNSIYLIDLEYIDELVIYKVHDAIQTYLINRYTE